MMKIRKMKMSDLAKIMVLENDLFYTPWTKTQYRYELNENPYAKLWVMEDDADNDIIGYYDLWIIFEHAEIATIAIAKPYQKKGYGSKLMSHLLAQAMMEMCETVSLEVRVSNMAARNLYEHYGFTTVNTKPGYYECEGGHEDALFMMKGI